MEPEDKTRPDVGRMVPAIKRKSVLLPAPLRPKSATLAPVGKVVVKSSTMTFRPPRDQNVFVRRSSWIRDRSGPVPQTVIGKRQDAPGQKAEKRNQKRDAQPFRILRLLRARRLNVSGQVTALTSCFGNRAIIGRQRAGVGRFGKFPVNNQAFILGDKIGKDHTTFDPGSQSQLFALRFDTGLNDFNTPIGLTIYGALALTILWGPVTNWIRNRGNKGVEDA